MKRLEGRTAPDPADVVKRYVELVEADQTELVNFIPPDIVQRPGRPRPA